MTARRAGLLVAAVLAAQVSGRGAEVYLRWNQAGYRPHRPKVLIAMSDADLRGRAWRIERVEASASERAASAPVLRGVFGARIVGRGRHTPLPFNHAADFSALVSPGKYRFVCADAAPAELRIADDPYASLVPQLLQHLRFARSGTTETHLRRPSHLGDARAPVFVPDGAINRGKWKPRTPARQVDALGGWYDAGDQIKFTLNIAYTTYHLLLAYRLDPARFTNAGSPAGWAQILDEARHGLEFLVRTFPDADTFIIQVGDERDHDQPLRLPEDDQLDGRRPALCALSRVHMAAASAALARGARTWREFGRDADAARYAQQAVAIYARSRGRGTVRTAFERGAVNDFYRDTSDRDQLALAATELHALTGERAYLADARGFAPPAVREVSWAQWNWLANAALAPHDAAARARLLREIDGYSDRAQHAGQPWAIPGRYVWASLHRWIGEANATRYASLLASPTAGREAVFFGVLDYTFGRNNWGVSFLFSEQLPNSVRQIYNPAYHLLGAFPTGALSEGPGDRKGHDALRQYFEAPRDAAARKTRAALARFNTPAGVFYDDAEDFMCQEATIGGQADAVLLLTLASIDAPRVP